MSDQPRFCDLCGGALHITFADGRDRPVCTACGSIVYRNPLPCVAAVVVQQSRLLLVKRKIEPGIGEWGLPAGFMEWGEDPKTALYRELQEETGLSAYESRLLTVSSEIISPYGHVLILGYAVNINPGEVHPGDDAADARFLEFDSLPHLAFKSHREIWNCFLSLSGKPR